MEKYSKYDGVICFAGEDWWYHNHGHFDMKVMECLSKDKKILFVNSVGMRVPTIGKSSKILNKIIRKLKSIAKGAVKVSDNFFVYSPFYLPGKSSEKLSAFLLKIQIQWYAKQLGMSNPLIWVVTPTVSKTALELSKDVIYQRTDKNEELSDGDFEYIKQHVKLLQKSAMLTIYSSNELKNSEELSCKKALHISHGIADVFFDKRSYNLKNELNNDNAKKVLFVGAIDSHTFDIKLLLKAAAQHSDVNFYLVGDVSLDNDINLPSNVIFLGKKEQEEIPSYLNKADVLAMYWLQNDWIKYCSPIKFKEYLSAGKPIVSTQFSGCYEFESKAVYISNCHETFLVNLSLALNTNITDKQNMTVHTWSNKTNDIIKAINEI